MFFFPSIPKQHQALSAFIIGLCIIPLLSWLIFSNTLAYARGERTLEPRTRTPEVEEPAPEEPPQDETEEGENEEPENESSPEPDEPNTSEEPTGNGSTNAQIRRTNPDSFELTLQELGVLQLAAHDLFNMNRETEVDTENGKLDLSTLLHYGEANIALGGEPRNRENIILFTVAKMYGERYVKYLDNGKTEQEAYERVLKRYHKDLELVYMKLFDESFPVPADGAVTNTENLALRTIHDFLPGTIVVDGERLLTVDHILFGRTLSQSELKQRTSPLDGQFDEEFLDVVIFIPPDMIMHISLLERDSSFADQFNTEHSFEHFMSELEDGSYDENDDVSHYIKELFAKGLNF